MALRIHRAAGDVARRKALLWLAIGGNLAVLGYFKYYDFFVSSTQNLADGRRDRASRSRCGP